MADGCACRQVWNEAWLGCEEVGIEGGRAGIKSARRQSESEDDRSKAPKMAVVIARQDAAYGMLE